MKKKGILIIILSCLAIGIQAQVETYWDNGNLKSKTHHDENGVKIGYWSTYFEGGETKEAGYYENGKKSGTWNEYFYNGTRKKRTTYRNGLLQGIETYYENGRDMVTGQFDNDGKKSGSWEQFYDNWQLKLEGDYWHDKKHGLWKYFTKTGKLFKAENYKEGVLFSKWEGDKENNINYKVKNATDVVEESYVEEVEATSEVVIDAAADAVEVVVESAEDAVDAVVETRSYYGNRLNGQWKFYNENGKVVEIGHYNQDRKDGKWTSFYNNGKIKKIQLWKQDKLMEVVSYFDEQGKPFEKGSLKNGNGTVKEYDKNNNLIATVDYIDGKELDWNNSNLLNTLAWDIYENKTDKEVLESGIKMVKRSIELEKNYYNTDTYAALLYKTGNYKLALIKALEAIRIAKKDGDDYSTTTELIKQINKKI